MIEESAEALLLHREGSPFCFLKRKKAWSQLCQWSKQTEKSWPHHSLFCFSFLAGWLAGWSFSVGVEKDKPSRKGLAEEGWC